MLLEEVSFRALQQWRGDNKLHLPKNPEIAEIHAQTDKYEYVAAVNVHKAPVR